MSKMNTEVMDVGNSRYLEAVGYNDMPRDRDGFIRLKPSAERVDDKAKKLTTDITDLEAKLRKFQKEKVSVEKYQKSDEYQESKKKGGGKKKQKKARNTLLEMVFNNADGSNGSDDDEDDEDGEDGYRDSRKKKAGEKKKNENTLDTTYGKRFSPVVSMLHDSISEFDALARDIEEELHASRGNSKNMYRSSQIGNLITAKNSKLSAVKELASVAKIVSDLEYKQSKDKQAEDSDGSKAIARIGAKYLRSGLMDDDDDKKKGKKKKDRGYDKGSKKSYSNDDDDDDDDDEDGYITKSEKKSNQKALAEELANSLIKNKDKFSFTAHEKNIHMEGKYKLVVVVDPTDPKDTWEFMALDPKTEKELPDFKSDYKDLVPKRKTCRMKFDIAKLKCTDLNTSRTYKLYFMK